MRIIENKGAVCRLLRRLVQFGLAIGLLAMFVSGAAAQETKPSAAGMTQEQKPATKEEPKAEVKVESPKLIAVEFYADWCNACKVLMPKITEAKTHLQDKSVLFVRFDMTNDFTKQQASLMAAYSGLEDVYRRGGGKTGMVALVDPKSKNVLAVIGQKKTQDEIAKMFDDAVTKANAN